MSQVMAACSTSSRWTAYKRPKILSDCTRSVETQAVRVDV